MGPQQNLSQATLDSLGEKLTAALGRPIAVARVNQIDEGANNASHFAAQTATGEYIGLKACSRGVTNAAEKERLVAAVATVLRAPNFCAAAAVTIDEIPVLSGQDVNAIVWLPRATQLNKLDAAAQMVLKNAPKQFLEQYGESASGWRLG